MFLLTGLLVALTPPFSPPLSLAISGGQLELLALDNPGGRGARYPHYERGGDGRAYLSWTELVEGHARLSCAALRTHGFSPPELVAEGDDWFVNWADIPVVTALADGSLAGFWLQKGDAGPYAYGVRYRLKTDGKWGAANWLHEDRGPVEHGFVSARPSEKGWDTLWLDGRSKSSMGLFLRRLGSDGSLTEELLLDERVCDCCNTALTRLDDGTLLCVYRDRSEAELRDLSFVLVLDGKATEPAPVNVDNWTITGCPVNGPALVARGDRAACAWYTESPTPRVKLAVSNRGAEGFAPPVRVDEAGSVGRVSLAWLEDGSLLVSHLVETDEEQARGEWRVRRFVDGEPAGDTLVVAQVDTTRSTGFLRLLSQRAGALAAWTEITEGSYSLRTARIRVR